MRNRRRLRDRPAQRPAAIESDDEVVTTRLAYAYLDAGRGDDAFTRRTGRLRRVLQCSMRRLGSLNRRRFS